MNFTKQQKFVCALLLIGTFLLGIALSEWILDDIFNLRYQRGTEVMFGMFGLMFLVAALGVRILLIPKDPQ